MYAVSLREGGQSHKPTRLFPPAALVERDPSSLRKGRAGGEGLKAGGKQGAVASDGNNNTWIWLNIYPKEVKF